MKKLLSIGLVLAMLSLSACSKQSYHMSNNELGTPITQQETKQHFFIGGIGQEEEIDAAEICGGADKVVRVESKESFWDSAFTGLTLGIYAPRTAVVYCKE